MKKPLGMKRENLGLGGTEIENPSWQRLIPTSREASAGAWSLDLTESEIEQQKRKV
jgi:hypothetical protein